MGGVIDTGYEVVYPDPCSIIAGFCGGGARVSGLHRAAAARVYDPSVNIRYYYCNESLSGRSLGIYRQLFQALRMCWWVADCYGKNSQAEIGQGAGRIRRCKQLLSVSTEHARGLRSAIRASLFGLVTFHPVGEIDEAPPAPVDRPTYSIGYFACVKVGENQAGQQDDVAGYGKYALQCGSPVARTFSGISTRGLIIPFALIDGGAANV